MNNNQPTLIRLIRAPIMLVLLGSLFVLGQNTEYAFHRTWPVLIIVFGVLKLLERVAGRPGESEEALPPGGDR